MSFKGQVWPSKDLEGIFVVEIPEVECVTQGVGLEGALYMIADWFNTYVANAGITIELSYPAGDDGRYAVVVDSTKMSSTKLWHLVRKEMYGEA